ncbi:hypothetical protein EJB05_00361 [Eragrostis curvula]|uniref:Uncharacterized protein n=1 Tax=Eragrostis curvula TaxID=38414 RepID=A0A5J9WNV8_9POAL|nr:hypothetical protein EJB05_00361 [Eragrostis curvula]
MWCSCWRPFAIVPLDSVLHLSSERDPCDAPRGAAMRFHFMGCTWWGWKSGGDRFSTPGERAPVVAINGVSHGTACQVLQKCLLDIGMISETSGQNVIQLRSLVYYKMRPFIYGQRVSECDADLVCNIDKEEPVVAYFAGALTKKNEVSLFVM